MKHGYSLVEFLLVLALLALVLEAALGLFVLGLGSWQRQDEDIDLMTAGYLALSQIKPEIRQARRVIMATDKEIEFLRPSVSSFVAATDQGIFRYNPIDDTWEDMTGDFPGGTSALCLLLSSKGTLLAGASDGKVYKTTDLGRSWTATSPLAGASRINCLMESSDGETIYAGTSSYGDVFKTTDEGNSWNNTGNLTKEDVDATEVLCLTEDTNGVIYAGTGYTGNANIFKTADKGVSWQDITLYKDWWNTDYTYQRGLSIRNNSATVLPAGYSVKLYLDHYGLVRSGKLRRQGDDVRIVYWDGGQYIEIDRINETVWNNRSTLAEIWFQTQASIPADSVDNNYYLYYGNSSPLPVLEQRVNVYLFWDDFSAGLDTVNIWNIAGTPSVVGGVAQLDSGEGMATKATFSKTVFETRLRWNPVAAAVRWGWANNLASINPPYTLWNSRGTENLYPDMDNGTGSGYTGAGILTDNNFYQWAINWASPETKWFYNQSACDRTTLADYTSNQSILIHNINSANRIEVDWAKVRRYRYPEPDVTMTEEIERGDVAVLSLAVDAENNLYAGISGLGDVLKSADEARTGWSNTATLIEADIEAENIFCLLAGENNRLYAGTSPAGNIFRSTNQGKTWRATGDLLDADEARTMLSASDGTLYAGTYPDGDVFASVNHGADWIETADIPGAARVYSLAPLLERVKVFWSGTRFADSGNPDDLLSRTDSKGMRSLEDGLLKTFRIDYFNEDLTPADTLTQSGRNKIRLIRITLTMERNGAEYTLKNTVRIRE